MSDLTKAEAAEKLLQELKPGDTVYTVLRHVSKSGMSRSIDVVLLKPDGPWLVSWLVSYVLKMPIDQKNGGVKTSGCGMDMGFHLIYELSHALFPKGFKVDGTGRNGDTSGWDNDGGYALKQRWL